MIFSRGETENPPGCYALLCANKSPGRKVSLVRTKASLQRPRDKRPFYTHSDANDINGVLQLKRLRTAATRGLPPPKENWVGKVKSIEFFIRY